MSFDIFPQYDIFTGFELKFKAIRVINGELNPSDFTVRVELAPLEDSSESNAIGDTFRKIHYFVENVLNNAVFIDRLDEWSAMTFVDLDTGLPNCANNLVHMASTPNNVEIAKLLQCKFSALASESLMIAFVNVMSSDSGGMSITCMGDTAESLPSMDDWVGTETYFSKPWWCRDDASTMDLVPAEGANLAEPPEFAYSLNFLFEAVEVPADTPSKVVRAEFRPQVIQGGKTD